jgi:short-subunit dehydrogenase
MDIKDKVVIVTGASSGIGLAAAELLTKRGARVALVARSIERLHEISKRLLDSHPIQADMAREDDVKSMVKETKHHYGRIDVLINNAGQGCDAPVEKLKIETYRKIFELNIVGPLIAMQQVIPIMREQKEGMIVNISSGLALMCLPNMSPYASMKSALVNVSLTAREELKKDNIQVSVVYPYITDTDFEKNTIREIVEEISEHGEDHGTLRPPDSPEYVAQKIVEGIESGDAEIFAHDWMRKMKRS